MNNHIFPRISLDMAANTVLFCVCSGSVSAVYKPELIIYNFQHSGPGWTIAMGKYLCNGLLFICRKPSWRSVKFKSIPSFLIKVQTATRFRSPIHPGAIVARLRPEKFQALGTIQGKWLSIIWFLSRTNGKWRNASIFKPVSLRVVVLIKVASAWAVSLELTGSFLAGSCFSHETRVVIAMRSSTLFTFFKDCSISL